MATLLSPDKSTSGADLADAASVFRNITAFARSCETAQLGALSPEPAWLSDVRTALTGSQKAAGAWYIAMPPWVAAAAQAYIDYAAVFAPLAKNLTPVPSNTEIITGFLNVAQTTLRAKVKVFTDLQANMKQAYSELATQHTAFKKALTDAQSAYVEAAEGIAKINDELLTLQDSVLQYTKAATDADLSAGQTVVSTVVKIIIPVLAGAAFEFPFVAIGMTVFSVGKLVYGIIKDDEKIQAALTKIRTLLDEEDADVQALAASHAVSILLDTLEDIYDQSTQHLPRISEMWQSEADKISIVIDALEDGADPQKLPELANIAAALETWNYLASVANGMLAAPQSGGQLELNPADAGNAINNPT